MTKKILIIGPAWVGDLVMAQSLFKLIKQREPEARLHVMVPPAYLPLLAAMPEIEQGLPLPFKHGELSILKRWRLARELKAQGYTHSIVLPNSWKSALIPFFTSIATRTGWKGESRWGLLNDLRYLNKAKLPLMIQRFDALGLAKLENLPQELPWPSLSVSVAAQNAVIAKFNLQLNKPVLVLCPGAEYGPAKRWPAAHYAKIAETKIAEGWQVWIMGAAGDKAVAEEIQSNASESILNFAGKTNLAEAMSLLNLATAVVSNDSGLMHIANALHKPVVVVYGSSSPKFTPPLSVRAQIVKLDLDCQPCFKRTCPLKHLNCLNQLPPNAVLQALVKATV